VKISLRQRGADEDRVFEPGNQSIDGLPVTGVAEREDAAIGLGIRRGQHARHGLRVVGCRHRLKRRERR